MEIKDLQVGQGKVDIEMEITDKSEVREFMKFDKPGRVCNAKAKDGSGEITLTLWNEDIDKVNVGDKVKISNGYVSEWQGEKQLSTGRFGTLEVVGSATPAKEAAPTEAESPEEKSMDVEEEDIV